jgi:hypothetical protein
MTTKDKIQRLAEPIPMMSRSLVVIPSTKPKIQYLKVDSMINFQRPQSSKIRTVKLKRKDQYE